MRRSNRVASRGGFAASLILASTLLATPVHAIPIQYTFHGIATTGTLSGLFNVVNLAGAPFTATGMILNETDLTPTDTAIGVFAATTTYDFGALGSFTTDPGADGYFQSAGGPFGSVIQFGLVDATGLVASSAFGFRFQGFFSPNPLPDPNIPTAVGPRLMTQGPFGLSRTQTNSVGQTLVLGLPISGTGPVNVDIQAVPEPGSGVLLGFGLLWMRRHRQR